MNNIVSSEFDFLKPLYFPNLKRIGAKNDGGYIVPDTLLRDSDGLLSFGYGYDSSFERDYIQRTQNQIFIYDHTCDYKKLIFSLLKTIKRFFLFRKNIRDVKKHYKDLEQHYKFVNSKNVFFNKKEIVKEKKNQNEINLNEIFQSIFFKKAILKCDIEGSEYEILQDIITHSEKIICILIEFHNIDQNIEKFKKSMNKLCEIFSIVHLHGNNHEPLLEGINIPKTLEITLVKKKFVNETKFVNKFPIKDLDSPNNPSIGDLEFEFQN